MAMNWMQLTSLRLLKSTLAKPADDIVHGVYGNDAKYCRD